MLRRIRFETPAGEQAALEFGDPVRDLSCLFLHATGFNAMTYQSIMAPLGLRARVAALDIRGHGRTTLPGNPSLASWSQFRDDVIAWIEAHAPQGLVLGGHSMGGCVALLVAGKRPDLVKGLVLADPVILSPRAYRAFHLVPFSRLTLAQNRLSRAARKRRPSFAFAAEARLSYEGRGAFRTWREPFLDDYLLDGLKRTDDNPLDSPDQTWELACPPAFEAAIFAAQRNRPWHALRKVRKARIPLTILRGEKDSVLSNAVEQRLLARYPNAVIKTIRGTSHFLPMEAPYALREELSEFLARLVEGFTAADEGPVRHSLGPAEGTRMA